MRKASRPVEVGIEQRVVRGSTASQQCRQVGSGDTIKLGRGCEVAGLYATARRHSLGARARQSEASQVKSTYTRKHAAHIPVTGELGSVSGMGELHAAGAGATSVTCYPVAAAPVPRRAGRGIYLQPLTIDKLAYPMFTRTDCH